MDAITIKYYDDNANSAFAMYSSLKDGVEKYSRLAFPPGSEIQDVGSGSGRDVNLLINEEYEAYGAEPSCKLRSLALSKMPQLQGRMYSGALPNLAEQIGRTFDGILCSAVFQHVPEEQQFDAAFDKRRQPPHKLLAEKEKRHNPDVLGSTSSSHSRKV
jgi:2-polyprenyl-3-methyl-5-hydroxy-6-metoxy-1,4-benzoquinol methylase